MGIKIPARYWVEREAFAEWLIPWLFESGGFHGWRGEAAEHAAAIYEHYDRLGIHGEADTRQLVLRTILFRKALTPRQRRGVYRDWRGRFGTGMSG